MVNIIKDNLKMIKYMVKDNFINIMEMLLKGYGHREY